MELAVLPLAIGVIAGPQILSALLFITTSRPVQTSVAYVSSFLVALTAGVIIAWLLFRTVFASVQLGEHKQSTVIKVIQLVLAGTLIVLALRAYLTRHTSKPPKWLTGLSSAHPRQAFKLGWLLVWLMPSDLLIMATVGSDLVRTHHTAASAWPFIALVAALLSLPLLLYVIFRKKIQANMPHIRASIITYSWAVNIGVYILFACILIFNG